MPFHRLPARFGSYILLDRIASGGMAEVYRAKASGAEDFQRLLAIKCMRPDLLDDPQFVPMFIDEAKIAAQLNHSNIVQIYELGRVGSRLYIAMELVWGKDLKQILRSTRLAGRYLPLELCAYVVQRASEALDYAHHFTNAEGKRPNVIHRDVSPQNLLLTYDGQLKVVDFGIARADDRETRTQAGVLKGKFAYMAPEQTLNLPLDYRVDIFALGSVFFELLTGRQLFAAENQLAIVEKVRAAEVPPIQTLRPELPAALDDILVKALARRPEQRYGTALELGEAVSRFLIRDNSIFGARQAGAFMHALYTEEIERAAGLLRHYLEIVPADCDSVPDGDTQVFERTATGQTAFGRRPAANADKTLVIEAAAELAAAKTLLTADAAHALRGSTAVAEGPGPRVPTPAPFAMDATDRDKPPAPTRVDRAAAVADRTLLVPMGDELTASSRGLMERTLLTEVTGVTPENTLTAPVELGAPEPEAPSWWPPKRQQLLIGGALCALLSAAVALGMALGSPQPAPIIGVSVPDRDTRLAPESWAQQAQAGAAPGDRREAWGYLSVRVTGAAAARVYVDNRDVGYSPLHALRVRAGKRRVKVVEVIDGKPGRAAMREVEVGIEHDRQEPLRVIMEL